jgi:hypothetical protein
MKRYLIILYIFIIVFGYIIINAFEQYKTPVILTYQEYTVQAGDTLWSIAEKFPHDDIRELVYLIRTASHADPVVHPGELLLIPIIKTENNQ